MSDASQELKDELRSGLVSLSKLKDEIHLKMHLAGMDAKDQWAQLNEEINRAEVGAKNAATNATRTALDETIKKLEKFRATLG